MPCKKCSHPIDAKTDTFTVCQGRCSKTFHAHCVGLTADTVRALCKNVIWLCDDCLVEFGSVRYREKNECMEQQQPPHIIKDVAELKTQVARIIEMLSEAKQKPSTENISFIRHSTPVSSEPSTKISSCSDSSSFSPSRKDDHSTIVRDHSFSLVLSNIDNRVTDHEIGLLVSQSLGTKESDNVRVTKLVPRWKVCEEMDYVSFKVVLDEKWRDAALSVSTWPQQIRYREFVNRRAVTWHPIQ